MLFVITSQGQNKLLSSIEQFYDGASWANSTAQNYEYDSNNNLISETDFRWTMGAWKNDEKTIYTYNPSNKVTEILYQEWNAITNKFENTYKDTYAYTAGKVTELMFKKWENSQWVDYEKATLGYNVNNLLESGLAYSWDGTQWVNEDRELYTYVNNKLTGDFGETLRNSQWQNDFRGTYAYTNNKMTSFINEDWSNGVWSQSENTVFQIDATGNRTSKTSVYNNNGTFKDEYIYDTTSQMSSFAHPFADKTGLDFIFEDFPYVNKILATNQYYYDTVSSSYKLSNRTTYNYNSLITLSTEQPELAITTVTVFPNPTTSVLNLNFSNGVTIDKVVIVDVTGRVVIQQEVSTAQINVEKLTAGLYIIEAYSGKDKFTSKFVKK